MRKFYQNLYVRVSKQLSKEGSSKKKVLERLAQNLKNTHKFMICSVPEIVVHLGSVIYPSKVNTAFLHAKTPISVEGQDLKKLRAKQLVAQFQDCMVTFSCQKLEKLLQDHVFSSLYQFFCENLEASLQKKQVGKEGCQKSTLNMLTSRIIDL